jgi:hypothetical protein
MALVRQTLPFDVLHAAAPADTQVRFSHHVDMFYPKKMHGQGAPMDQDFVPLRLRVRAFFERWPGALKARSLIF